LSPVEKSEAPAPVVLPQLVDLSLCGLSTSVAGFMGQVINMTSPLHNVAIRFRSTSIPAVADLVSTTKKLLTAYYRHEGLGHPREVNHLAVASTSSSMPGLAPLLLPFSLWHVSTSSLLSAERLDLVADDLCETLRKMKGLVHLQLGSTGIGPVLDALDSDDICMYREAT